MAVDAVSLMPGEACPMPLACTFAAGLCRWSNARADDFDWTMVRSTAARRGCLPRAWQAVAPVDLWVGSMPRSESFTYLHRGVIVT